MKQLIFLVAFFVATINSVPIHAQVALAQDTEATEVLETKSLEESLEFVVAKAIEIAETTGEFVVDQAPLLLQEFYAWESVKAIGWIIFTGLITAAFIVFTIMCIRYEDDDYTGGAVACGCFAIVSSVFLFINSMTLVMINVAPKLYLIEHFVGRY